MRVNIISEGPGWILHKFGQSVYEQLQEMGIQVTLSQKFDKDADINHYFFANYADEVDKHTTFMITHVDTQYKIDRIREQTDKGAIGICMSLDTRNKLIANGVNSNRICYINPAQDEQIQPRKIVLGFTHRVYSDNRKRETMLIDICKQIKSKYFKLSIMGAGWESIIEELKSMGYEIDYYPEFDKQKYNELIKNLDYYCYFGFDEGSMGFLDAVAAGVKTIVTPQGYHLDTECGITHPVETISDIVSVLKKIEHEREQSEEFSHLWTWKNYTLKHLEIWKYMLGSEQLSVLLNNRGWYKDGIFSLTLDELDNYVSPMKKIFSQNGGKKL